MAKREKKELGAGAMADIAFLLLIFFLVSTTIQTDAGLNVLLPPYIEQPPRPVNKRNVFSVQLNAANELFVRGSRMSWSETKLIKEQLKTFIMNHDKDPNSSETPTKAVVSILTDNGTSYESYITVYNEVKAAYNGLWEQQAQNLYGRSYQDLGTAEQSEIRKIIPLVISEAEPTSLAKL